MKNVNTVIETYDYSKFKDILGNRNINNLNVKRLVQSFQKSYLMSPIIVNENFEIIDGQHRFLAAKKLQLPINYIMVKGYSLDEVKSLNETGIKWSKKDHLNAYVELGYPAYLKFKEFMDQYPDFSLSACEVFITNQLSGSHISKSDSSLKSDTNKRGYYAVRYFQEGDLQIDDYDLACENAEKVLMIKPFYDGYSRALFVRAMVGIFRIKEYSHNQLINRLEANPTAMQHCSNISQYKILIEEIYNFRSRNKISLRY